MCATLLQFFSLVSYFFPTICFCWKTSNNLNSTDIFPLLDEIFPETKCCAFINFQSSNLGLLDRDWLSWINDLLSIGKKSPDLSKLSEITVEIFLPTLVNCEFFEYSSVTAIGVGLTLPVLESLLMNGL